MNTQNFESGLRYTITHWFQPIYHLKDNNVIGYEALLRDASELQVSPVDIFKDAERKGCRNKLDLISIKTAFEAYKGKYNLLFLNVFPTTILEEDFLSWWDTYMPPMVPVVLELLENEPISDWKGLKKVTKGLQARGIKIAVDDMGIGYSFYQQWIELNPDFVKLDRYFSQNLSEDLRKQKVLRSLIDLFSDTTEMVIEGIERKEDLDIAELLGISYAQGYLLGKPSPGWDLSAKH